MKVYTWPMLQSKCFEQGFQKRLTVQRVQTYSVNEFLKLIRAIKLNLQIKGYKSRKTGVSNFHSH